MQWGAFAVEVAPEGDGFRLLHGADCPPSRTCIRTASSPPKAKCPCD